MGGWAVYGPMFGIARNAGWANPEAAADLRDDDLDPRKPRTERELAIMEAGVDELTSSDSAEDTERSEATAEKLEDLAALIYRAYGPQRGFNQTAAGLKHRSRVVRSPTRRGRGEKSV